MKKLIVPIIIGLVMFGAAFGGAFYFFRSDKAREEAAIKAVTETVLAALQKQGKAVVYTGRVVAVAAPEAAAPAPAPAAPDAGKKGEGDAAPHSPAAAPPAAHKDAAHKEEAVHTPAVAHAEEAETHDASPAAVPGGKYAIVPATVRYEVDFKALRKQDVVWDDEAHALKVTLPAPSIAEPEIDAANIRQIGGAAPEDAVRRGALGALLEQAREEAALGQARETARQMVERAFALPLLVEGVKKAKVVVRFADEPADEDEEEGGGAPGGH